jgi:hypothetical protein
MKVSATLKVVSHIVDKSELQGFLRIPEKELDVTIQNVSDLI